MSLHSSVSGQTATGGVLMDTIVKSNGHAPQRSVADMIVDQIPVLRRYARALVKNRDAADDLVQNTLVRAINAEHQWQLGTNLRGWLLTILHNVYVGDRRTLARRPAVVPIEDEQWHLEVPGAQVPYIELGELWRAIEKLPKSQQITVLLVGVQGMMYEEVAEVTGVPLGTVRSRLSRARGVLRERLGLDKKPTKG